MGQSYQASVDVYLNNASSASDSAQIWAYFVDDSGAHWQKMGGQTIATHGWQTISAPVNINANGAVTQLQLHVIGPKPATQLIIDNFRVR